MRLGRGRVGTGTRALLRLDARGAAPPDACRQAHATLVEYLDKVVAFQDPESGLWWQVLDAPNDERNYVETRVEMNQCVACTQ